MAKICLNIFDNEAIIERFLYIKHALCFLTFLFTYKKKYTYDKHRCICFILFSLIRINSMIS